MNQTARREKSGQIRPGGGTAGQHSLCPRGGRVTEDTWTGEETFSTGGPLIGGVKL